ncbi:MAG: hypothetical protein AAF597_03730, partial [Bacteroidota bacterium]
MPNSFIIYFDPADGPYPNTTSALVDSFKNQHGVIVNAVQLNQAATYFSVQLVKMEGEVEPSGKFCNFDAEYPLECELCDILGNPGGGGPMGRGNDTSPLHFGSTGVAFEYDPDQEYNEGEIFMDTTDQNGFASSFYDPLVGLPGLGSSTESENS